MLLLYATPICPSTPCLGMLIDVFVSNSRRLRVSPFFPMMYLQYKHIMLLTNKTYCAFQLGGDTEQSQHVYFVNSLVKDTWHINGTAVSLISLLNEVGITGFIFCKVFTLCTCQETTNIQIPY